MKIKPVASNEHEAYKTKGSHATHRSQNGDQNLPQQWRFLKLFEKIINHISSEAFYDVRDLLTANERTLLHAE